jgi:hypothetical protein
MDVISGEVRFECKVYNLCEAELSSIAAWILPSLYTSNPILHSSTALRECRRKRYQATRRMTRYYQMNPLVLSRNHSVNAVKYTTFLV